MYTTLAPGLVAGVLNMVWCTAPVAHGLARPVDGGRTWRGRRIFGDNKTWKGVVGMAGLGAACGLVWGGVCAAVPALHDANLFYTRHTNTPVFSTLVGLAVGLAYAAAELPNSFVKRRLGVAPGKPAPRPWGVVVTVTDQVDSVLAMVLVVAVLAPMSPGFFAAYVALGGATHAVVNLLLYIVHLRKNPL